ncbi:hypothetical protein GOBAR_AA01314 [Gossypium barbadense]|uniref:Transmembrane protein n=2 Tax=Gossypium TaxID=3633 RepID=A0ABR0MIA6_GOSAR|nr:hypothetical protein PVK06_049312 [Gossypium arboreum]PPS19251.1 hypothetical protein GOBAR_AA01314 [Gossypium barbadense]
MATISSFLAVFVILGLLISDAGVVVEATEAFPGSFKYGMLAKRGKTPPSPPSPTINPIVHQLPEPPPAAPPST